MSPYLVTLIFDWPEIHSKNQPFWKSSLRKIATDLECLPKFFFLARSPSNKFISIFDSTLKFLLDPTTELGLICLSNILLWNLVALSRFSRWRSVIFKSVLSSCSENTGTVTRDHVKSSQMRNETSLNSKGFCFMLEQE